MPFPVVSVPRWREVGLWWPARKALVVTEALGTSELFTGGDRAVGVHLMLRLLPPRRLGGYAPEHLLVGHGPPIHGPVAASGVARPVALAARRAPRAHRLRALRPPLTDDDRREDRTMRDRIEEAPLRAEDAGLVPEGDGWFIVNVAQASGIDSEQFGGAAVFEGREGFPELGINVRLLAPGQPASMYHREDVQEAFLVLSGRCLAIVEDEERPMAKGDLLHCPAAPRT